MRVIAPLLRRAVRRVTSTPTRQLAAAVSLPTRAAPAAQLLPLQQLTPPLSSQAARAFSTGGAPVPPPIDAEEENRFLELADTTLHDILSWLDGIEEMLEESDISLAQGVLKIDLGEVGTWVLNRQIPNRQLWWSSPISGPRRYEFNAASGTWLNTRDGSELMELLRAEILEATGIEIYD